MEGVALERSLRTVAAAAGAEHIARAAMEELVEDAILTPELRELIEEFDACISATMRAAIAFASEALDDDPPWEVVVATLDRMNRRLWEQTTHSPELEGFFLTEVLEEMLADTVSQCVAREQALSGIQPYDGWALNSNVCVDDVVAVATIIADGRALTAVHLLMSVALRAMAEVG